MKTNPYRNHSVAAALAAALVTTVLAGSIVEGFNPAEIGRAAASQGSDTLIALARRDEDPASRWT
jgi:hypothetical protein